MNLSVREFQYNDIEKIVDYFINADTEFLIKLGADQSKLPKREEWIQTIKLELEKPYDQKELFYMIWLVDDEAIGHSNVNNIEFGVAATMHLHLWESDRRRRGLGEELLTLTIPYYFKYLQLQKLICEPFSENVAPNRTLRKVGFEFIKTYETTPGPINFLQVVNRYELTKSKLESD